MHETVENKWTWYEIQYNFGPNFLKTKHRLRHQISDLTSTRAGISIYYSRESDAHRLHIFSILSFLTFSHSINKIFLELVHKWRQNEIFRPPLSPLSHFHKMFRPPSPLNVIFDQPQDATISDFSISKFKNIEWKIENSKHKMRSYFMRFRP